MNSRAQSQAGLSSTTSFTPVPENLVQRKCACGGSAGLSGECAECQNEKLVGENAPLIQPKLKISQPNDKYEQEADRVAEEVMRMPFPAVHRQETDRQVAEERLQTKSLANQITPLVQRETMAEEGDEEEMLQAKGGAIQAPTVAHSTEAAIQSMRQGGGRPLDPVNRVFMEPRFRYDFGQVRIYTDHRAACVASSMNARAFTVGRDIFFGSGQYDPQSTAGRRLLAHELTHTMQQTMKGSTTAPEIAFREKGDGVPPEGEIDFSLYVTTSEKIDGNDISIIGNIHDGMVDLTSSPLFHGDIFVAIASDSSGNELLGKEELRLPPELEKVEEFTGHGIQLRVIDNLPDGDSERKVEASFELDNKLIRLKFEINQLPKEPDVLNRERIRNEEELSDLRAERIKKRRESRRAKRDARKNFQSFSRPKRKEQHSQFRKQQRERRAVRRDERRALRKQARKLRMERRQIRRSDSCDLDSRKMINNALRLAVDRVRKSITVLRSNGLQKPGVRRALQEFMRWAPAQNASSMDEKRMTKIIDTLTLAKNSMLIATHKSIQCASSGNIDCDKTTGAYVKTNVRGGIATICPAWIKGPGSNGVAQGFEETRAFALLHEFIHLSGPSADEEDKYYVHKIAWGALSAKQALGFADGYAALAWSLAKGVETGRSDGEKRHEEAIPESRSSPELQKEDERLNGPYKTVEQAVNGFKEKYNEYSKTNNEEVCSIVVKKGEQFFFLDGWQAIDKRKRTHSCPTFPPSAHERRKPKNFAGEVHTHGGADIRYENERPSPVDRKGCGETRGPCFIITPSDQVIKYGPDSRAGNAQHTIDIDRRRVPKIEPDRKPTNGEQVNLAGTSAPAHGIAKHKDQYRLGSLLRFLKQVERRKRRLIKTKRRCDKADEILKLIESKNAEFAEALKNEGITVTKNIKDILRELCGSRIEKAAPTEIGDQAENRAIEASNESKESAKAETSIFTNCNPPRDLIWKDFADVDPGTIPNALAQVNPILVSNEGANKISAVLGPLTRVEKSEKSKSVLEHEQIHWKITCKIVHLANKEIAAGTNFRDVFRVASEVHQLLNIWRDGLYDRDTLDPDATPKYNWSSEWSRVVEDQWESKVLRIRTITIEPLD